MKKTIEEIKQMMLENIENEINKTGYWVDCYVSDDPSFDLIFPNPDLICDTEDEEDDWYDTKYQILSEIGDILKQKYITEYHYNRPENLPFYDGEADIIYAKTEKGIKAALEALGEFEDLFEEDEEDEEI